MSATLIALVLPLLSFACIHIPKTSSFDFDPCAECQLPEIIAASSCLPQYSETVPEMTAVVDGDLCVLKISGCNSYYYNTTGSPCIQDSLRWGKKVCIDGRFVYELYGDVLFGVKCFN